MTVWREFECVLFRSSFGRALLVRDILSIPKHQCTVLQLVQRNTEGITEPQGTTKAQGDMTGEKRIGDIAARGAIHHQPTAARHAKGKERGTAPLPWGHPHLAGPEHHGNKAKVGRVKEELTAPAYDE